MTGITWIEASWYYERVVSSLDTFQAKILILLMLLYFTVAVAGGLIQRKLFLIDFSNLLDNILIPFYVGISGTAFVVVVYPAWEGYVVTMWLALDGAVFGLLAARLGALGIKGIPDKIPFISR